MLGPDEQELSLRRLIENHMYVYIFHSGVLLCRKCENCGSHGYSCKLPTFVFFFLFLSLSHVLSLVCDRKCHHHSATILCPRCCCSSLRDNNSPYTPFGYSALGSGPTMPFSLFLCYSVSWL